MKAASWLRSCVSTTRRFWRRMNPRNGMRSANSHTSWDAGKTRAMPTKNICAQNPKTPRSRRSLQDCAKSRRLERPIVASSRFIPGLQNSMKKACAVNSFTRRRCAWPKRWMRCSNNADASKYWNLVAALAWPADASASAPAAYRRSTSSEIADQAGETGLYDSIEIAEITEWLSGSDIAAFDLIAACDTLI
jgi:hypothetical protein